LYKEETYLLVDEHDLIFNDFTNSWYTAKKTYLTTELDIDNLPAALDALNTVHAFIREKERIEASSVAPLKDLGVKIKARKYHKLSHWDFPDSAKINNHENTVDTHLHELADLSSKKVEKHEDDVAREKYKEDTQLLVNEHRLVFNEFQSWFATKKAYLTHKENINTLPEALLALNLLNSYIRENERYVSTFVSSLKKLGQTINAREYNRMTNWVFPESDKINKVASDVDGHLGELHDLCNQKRATLEDDKAREEKKEELRLKFASQASNFKAFENEVITQALVTHFGFTLKEVEHFQAELQKIDSGIQNDVHTKKTEYEDTVHHMKSFNIQDNVYTSITVKDLVKSEGHISEAVGARLNRYEVELERQRFNDKLCQKFAQLVEPLSKLISDTKDAITTSKGNLEQQLELVVSKLQSRDRDGSGISQIKELAIQMEERQITHNEHTSLTVKDVEVQWEQYKLFLENKEKQLRDEIELARLRGLTQEDLNEIEDNFNSFDKNQNGYLETSELKTCLYSLGEERSKAQIEELVVKYGDGKKTLAQTIHRSHGTSTW